MASTPQLRVFLAGRVAVEADGAVIDEGRLSGRQGRLVFAYLVAEHGRPVPRDELAEALWGHVPPATWDKALTVIASKLRSLFKDVGVDGTIALTSAFGCYRLDLPDGSWVDVVVAANAAHAAEQALVAGSLEEAKADATLAASLVRRPFLPGEEGAWVEEKRRELAAVHGRALAVLVEACLLLGDPEAAKWAEQAIALEPFREAGYRRLMEAHVAAGNRAEALQVYDRCRRLLAEELGAYPSPETESVYRLLLETPTTQNGDAAASSAGETEQERARLFAPPRWSRRKSVATAVVAVGVSACAVAAVLATRSGTTRPSVVAADAVGLIDARSGRISAEVPVGATPTHVVVGEGAIWVTNTDGNSVSRIDPVHKVVVQTIPVGSGPDGIAAGGGFVWVANGLENTVSKIDPSANGGGGGVVDKIPVGNSPAGISYAAGSVWVANTGDDTITRIDADTDRPAKPLPIAATELAFGAGTLWASDTRANRVVRIDPTTGSIVYPIAVGNGPSAIAFGSDAAWVVNSLDGTVMRIDPTTNSVDGLVRTGLGTSQVAAGPGGVWVSNEFDGTLVRIDPRTDRPARLISVGNRPQGVAVSGGSVLVSVRQSGAGHRGGTLTIRMNRSPDTIDTALASDTTSIPFLLMTADGLVAFDQASGLAGTQPVPDLAVSLPTPTDGGRTYTFRLRPNVRYSNGKQVEASDFRYAFERSFKLGSQYSIGIVGVTRCVRRPKRCDLSHGVIADDAARTVTFHLVAPDPSFLYKLAFAPVVPAGTPLVEAGTHHTPPLPATGPYVVTSYRKNHSLTLGRNPYFHVWSRLAQPDGYPDKIVVEIGGTPDEAVTDVIHGRADAFSTAQSETPPTKGRLAVIETHNASQVHINPQPATIFLFLNTRVAPFDRLDVRRAVNYAADRAAAVDALGGPSVVEATCQILPPYSPGYRPYCPYTAGTTTRGTWAAPDLAKARALVARSGTRGMKITVWSWADLPGAGPWTVKLLQSLGYRVTLKERHTPGYWFAVGNSRTKAQIGTGEWISDYPAADGFYNPLLTCAAFVPDNQNNTNSAEFCDPRIDREVGQAVAQQATNPDAARRLWQRIDRQTVDQAPWVPLVNPKVVDVLSKRVGNYQYSLEGGMLIDQLWVH